ncbi:hypothetical protein BG006_005083 [Podila minutissima]|uniref:Uncharacterized protein n=1 Tax=Podila minutissima TaxID=64525 RepID=A0A9P5SPF6_9FUNG|nr:hypothetical protein BG006_005083 [Podila minutissima]
MRFSTTFLAIAIVALSSSTVSAQVTVDPTRAAACNQCLTEASLVSSPSCKGLDPINNPLIATLTETEKKCVCGLSESDAWMKTCDSKCDYATTNIATIKMFFTQMKTQACTGSKGSDGAATASSSLMVTGVTAAAAIVAAFAL